MTRGEWAEAKVLVADDAVTTRYRLCEFLSGLVGVGVEGSSAQREELLPRFATLNPVSVVIDPSPREQDPFATVGALRKRDRHCLLIVLTDNVGIETRARAIQAGADHCLEKSKDFERAVDLVARLVSTPMGR